jgi:intein/homing endonuclease
MQDNISKKDLAKVEILEINSKCGEKAKKAKKFLKGILKNAVQILPSENLRALIVATILSQESIKKCIAEKNVQLLPGEKGIRQNIALFADRYSYANHTAQEKQKRAVIHVGGSSENKQVYNLTVEQAHLYYANGILVTNTDAEDHCGDESRYRANKPNRTATIQQLSM